MTPAIGSRIKFILGNNISEADSSFTSDFGKSRFEILRIIELFRNLDTVQSEIIATLFACWNDLIIERDEITDSIIINEARNHWHLSKKRFSENRLMKALSWMKQNKLIPHGLKDHTHIKTIK